jgi:mannosylglycerate hydrolase
MSTRVSIVPHTHWDREWYQPFQSFRLKLVETLDEVLDLLESDPSYSCFLLDGQMAALDDYLEVRPEAAERVRELALGKRLFLGPWYVLMDEFLVSGETILRDLEMGLQRASAFGGAMEVGYLPDMFGHIAQMPQILRLAGFDHAVVWRGVPSAIDKSAFYWEALDGSRVRAEYLVTGYSNGQSLPKTPADLIRRAKTQAAEVESFTLGSFLYMNGTDHQAPQPWLGRLVEEANAMQDELSFEVVSLPEYLASAPTEGIPTWKGELRSGARANLLMGVASNRVDVKKAAAVVERNLERRAEPLAALLMPASEWPGRLLDLAWRLVVLNAAHDSICACSVDEVVDAVLERFAEARQIAKGVAEAALAGLARSLEAKGPVLVNPSARTRSGVVEVHLAPGSLEGGTAVQVLSHRGGSDTELTLDATTVRNVIGSIQGTQVDAETWVQEVRVEEDETGIAITVSLGHEERHDVPLEAIKRDIASRLEARPDSTVRVRMDQPATERVLALVEPVAGFGWRALEVRSPEHPVGVEQRGTGEPVVLANGLTEVVVDPREGTFSLQGITGYGRLVDGGDLGDSYNYSPPAQDKLVDSPASVEIEVMERGPIRGVVLVRSRYAWPESADLASSSRRGEVEVEVRTRLELLADDRALRVTTSFVNPSTDHRLRVHLPLVRPAASSEAECAFGIVTRGLDAEGRAEELGLPTFPSRRFVSAGGLTVAHEGLLEYELVDVEDLPEGRSARTLALTLLRSTGMLSRLGMAYRPMPAGPLLPVEGLQLLHRPIEARYALEVDCDDPYALVDRVFLPLEVVHATGEGSLPSTYSALQVEGAEVSAVRRVRGALELRLFNPRPAPADVKVGARRAWLVDLKGRPMARISGQARLRPFEIATIRIPDES